MEKFKHIDCNIELQKLYFNSQETKNVDFRIKQLDILKKAIIESEKDILNALRSDLNKSEFETYETEIGVIISEISYARKMLKRWNKCKKVKPSLISFGSKTYIYNQPYGVCLVIAPWNYPFQLSMSPLIGSIIAGNCTIIKPSEFAPSTSSVIAKMIEKYFDKKYISVIEGDLEVNKYILSREFDYIFFTGSPSVGKLVMKSASENLIPCTLELGGKSPCIVDSTSDVNLSAKKIIWGKLLNAGQTCIAPDYIIVHKSVKSELIKTMADYIQKFYSKDPIESDDYTSIVNKKHFERIVHLINYDKVVFGGGYSEEKLKIEPTIMDNVNMGDLVMKEEIFGPLIPIIEYEREEEIFDIVQKNKNPLALYLFTTNKKFEKRIINSISFGGGCINDTIMHITNPKAPFGGVGSSGMGSYHGKKSFETFSHQKTVLKSSKLMDMKLKYPPYSKRGLKLLKKIFSWI